MKEIVLIVVLTIALMGVAKADCTDPNLRSMKGVDEYTQLQYLYRLPSFFQVDD